MTAIEICLLQWDTYNKRMQKVLDELSDEKYGLALISGGNSPSWILGHLADTDDKLLELMGISGRLHPEWSTIYHHERGKNQDGHLKRAELITKWKQVVADLDKAFKSWDEKEWLSRHTAVTAEEFSREPHRNKLNVMLGRVAHKASHLGQVVMGTKA